MDWEVVHEMAEEEEAKKLRKIIVKEIFCNIHPIQFAVNLSVYFILNIITWYHFSSKIYGPGIRIFKVPVLWGWSALLNFIYLSQNHTVKRGNSNENLT